MIKTSGQEDSCRRVLTVSNILLALTGTLLIFCLAVFLVLNLRQIYYFDIDFLKIQENVGMDAREIRKNYDTLIDYNLITKQVAELNLPSFPMSETGRIHFEEVKHIFYAIQYAGVICLVLFLLGFVYKLRNRDFGFLKLMSIFSIVIPLLLGAAAFLDWQRFFVRFHELVFRNDYWLFDYNTDPVINILPDIFFFHCAAAVLLFIVLGSVLSSVFYLLLKRKVTDV